MTRDTHPVPSEPLPPQPGPELLAQIMHSVPALITYIDRDQRFLFANDAHVTLLKVSPHKLIGRHLSELMDAESYERARIPLQLALDGHAATFEGNLFKGELRRYVQGNFKPDLDEHGNVRGIFSVFTDISGRHALEEQLRESEQRFFQAFQHAAIGMALILPDGRYQRVNAALCDMLGYSEDMMLALSWQQVTHPDDLPTSVALARQLHDGRREAFQTEKRYVHRDGHLVYVLLSVSQVRNEAGETTYLVSQVQDISKRKQYEDALFRERQLAEVTLNSIGDAVITTDTSLTVTSINPIGEAMTGWTSAEAKGSQLDDIFRLRDPSTRQLLDSPLRQAMRRRATVDFSGRAILLHPQWL